ncbi:pseudouridine synthase [uncultured Eubacterium sp.]|uniref:pseudouridine synthase n=1 Tax=uncultured Eubacterium sp. TaxID=165185 RepID=UPI0026740470|nr:pseudouridine synthase [uncultured Eubacterium sp.]
MGDETKRIKNQIEENIRLNKFLSDAGYCSRREADRLIDAGKVMVNYKPALMGQKVSERDIVTVNGHKITREEEQIIIAFNKPVGVECTTDSKNPDNIVDYIGYEKRIYPIGRLDKNSQGLILLTNDGSIVNNILKASNCHEKEYIVTVDKPVTDSFLSAMSNGVKILDKVTRKCKVSKVSKHTFCIILTQGLNRQIRRMCEALGYNVQKLKRVRIMDVELGNLPIGQYRNLTDNEVRSLSNIKKYK